MPEGLSPGDCCLPPLRLVAGGAAPVPRVPSWWRLTPEEKEVLQAAQRFSQMMENVWLVVVVEVRPVMVVPMPPQAPDVHTFFLSKTGSRDVRHSDHYY